MKNQRFNEEFRFGSAAWSDDADLAAAGLFDGKGPQIGYSKNRPLNLDSDAPILLVGGAGSGKLRDILSYVVCNSPGLAMLTLDPRGELAAISMHNHARNGEYAPCWNPMQLCGNPHLACNPLDILKPDSPNLFGDSQFISEGIIPLSGGSNGKYFEMRGQEWVKNVKINRVEKRGWISFPELHRIINLVEADPQGWADILEEMLNSRYEDVRRTAAEMLAKQQDAPKEFGAIMGEIYAHLNFYRTRCCAPRSKNPNSL